MEVYPLKRFLLILNLGKYHCPIPFWLSSQIEIMYSISFLYPKISSNSEPQVSEI